MGKFQSSSNVTFSNPFKSETRSGYIWYAPAGTAIPATATEELAEAFKGIGYISEDGLVEPAAFEEADSIVAAGGDPVAKGAPTFNKTWTGTAIEGLNTDLLKIAYGEDNVTAADDGALTIDEGAHPLTHYVIVVDELLDGGRIQRSIMQDAQFLITGDIPHVHTELVSYEFSITAYPGEDFPAQRRYVTAAPKAPAEPGA